MVFKILEAALKLRGNEQSIIGAEPNAQFPWFGCPCDLRTDKGGSNGLDVESVLCYIGECLPNKECRMCHTFLLQ